MNKNKKFILLLVLSYILIGIITFLGFNKLQNNSILNIIAQLTFLKGLPFFNYSWYLILIDNVFFINFFYFIIFAILLFVLIKYPKKYILILFIILLTLHWFNLPFTNPDITIKNIKTFEENIFTHTQAINFNNNINLVVSGEKDSQILTLTKDLDLIKISTIKDTTIQTLPKNKDYKLTGNSIFRNNNLKITTPNKEIELTKQDYPLFYGLEAEDIVLIDNNLYLVVNYNFGDGAVWIIENV